MKRRFFYFVAALVALLTVFSCKKEEEEVIELESIMIAQDELDLDVGQTRQLSVKVFPENATAPEIEWSSDRTNIASVSETGLVKASPINEGSATITARCGDKEAHCTVKVTIPVRMFSFGEQSISLSVGDVWEWQVYYQPLTATERNNIVFENSDSSVAELKQDGSVPAKFKVTARKLGSTTIKAKCGGMETEMLVCVDAVKATRVTVNPSSITLDPLMTHQLTASVEPSNATNKRLFWYSMVPETATVDENGLVTAKRPGTVIIAVYCGEKYAYCNVTVTDKIPEGAVDLGLSVFWGSCNIGASSPSDYGDYYAWGETQTYYKDGHSQDNPCSKWRKPITGYDWGSYKFGRLGVFSRYSADSSGPFILLPEDDVAHVKLGGHWRMPTEVEFQELLDNCTSTPTTLNGKKGFKFTSNKTGYTDRWIFLPMAGYRKNTRKLNDGGHYWSSSLHTKYYSGMLSYILLLAPEDYKAVTFDERCLGFSVRPVCEIGQ